MRKYLLTRWVWAFVLIWSTSAASVAQWSRSELVWRDPAGISGYPTLAAGSDGVHILINTRRSNDSTVTEPDDVLLTQRTADGWSDPVNISHSPERSQTLAATTTLDGTFHAAWLEWKDPRRPHYITDLLYASKSGDVVSDPHAIVHTVEDSLGVPAFYLEPIYMVSGASGSLHLVSRMVFLDGAYIVYLRRENGVWSEPQRIGEQGSYYASLSRGPGGELLITCLSYDYAERKRVVALITSSDDGLTWSPPTLVAKTPEEERDFSPSVTVAPGGRMHVAWRHSIDGDLFSEVILHTYSDDGGATWSAVEEVRPPGGVVYSAETLADTLGRYHLFYFWEPRPLAAGEGRLYHTVWSNGRWSTPEKLFGADNVLYAPRSPGLAVDGRGRVHATWAQGGSRGDGVYYASADLTALGAEPETGEQSLPSNYPNPFRDSTTVTFTLATAGRAYLRLYTPGGRLVVERDLGERRAGPQTAVLSVNALASGVYFYKIQTGSDVQRGRLTVLL